MVHAASALTVVSAGIGVAWCFRARFVSMLRRWWSPFGADIFAPMLEERRQYDPPILAQIQTDLAAITHDIDHRFRREGTMWDVLTSRIRCLEEQAEARVPSSMDLAAIRNDID